MLEEEIQEGTNPRSVPPVPLEISSDIQPGQDVDTGIPHASISEVSGPGAGSICAGKDSVTSAKEGERDERGTNL